MSSRTTAGVLGVLGVALTVGGILLAGFGTRARTTVEATAAEVSLPVPPRADLTASPGAQERDAAAAPRASIPGPAPAPADLEPEALPADEPAGTPDLEARVPLALRVVNTEGVGIADAEVRIFGLRSTASPGSWFSYRGDEPVGRTDTHGRLTLQHWVWVDLDGRTAAVDLIVRHPEYTPFRESSFELEAGDLEAGEREVVLQRGSTVVVSAWIGEPARKVAPLSVQMDVEAGLRAGAWITNADGSVQTSQLEPGPHLLRVRHESAEHGLCFSAIESFTLGANDWQALHVELYPAERFVGVLDAAVPRPVVDGHVQICVRASGAGNAPSLYRQLEAPIASDGTFVVDGLPRGEAQLIALARGWSSKRMRPTSLEQAGITLFGDPGPDEVRETLDELEADSFLPQVVSIPLDASPYVVAMEPAATVELRAVSAAGIPVEGVLVGINPNVCYVNVGCGIVPWREWSGTTGADGRCSIVDVPPDSSLWASVHDKRWHARMVDGDRDVDVAARSGEVTLVEIVVEPKE